MLHADSLMQPAGIEREYEDGHTFTGRWPCSGPDDTGIVIFGVTTFCTDRADHTLVFQSSVIEHGSEFRRSNATKRATKGDLSSGYGRWGELLLDIQPPDPVSHKQYIHKLNEQNLKNRFFDSVNCPYLRTIGPDMPILRRTGAAPLAISCHHFCCRRKAAPQNKWRQGGKYKEKRRDAGHWR